MKWLMGRKRIKHLIKCILGLYSFAVFYSPILKLKAVHPHYWSIPFLPVSILPFPCTPGCDYGSLCVFFQPLPLFPLPILAFVLYGVVQVWKRFLITGCLSHLLLKPSSCSKKHAFQFQNPDPTLCLSQPHFEVSPFSVVISHFLLCNSAIA